MIRSLYSVEFQNMDIQHLLHAIYNKIGHVFQTDHTCIMMP